MEHLTDAKPPASQKYPFFQVWDYHYTMILEGTWYYDTCISLQHSMNTMVRVIEDNYETTRYIPSANVPWLT